MAKMTHKEYYTKHLKELRSRESALNSEMIATDDREARAEIGKTLKSLRDEIDEVEEMLKGIDEPKVDETVDVDVEPVRSAIVGKAEMRNGATDKNDTEKRAEVLKKENHVSMPASEARSVLVSSGALATPTEVGGISDPFSSVSSIVDMVRVEDMTGCGAYKEAYMKSWQTAAAGTEGQAPTPSDPQFGFVNIAPQLINTVSYVSREIRKQTPLQYLAKVQEGAAIALRKVVANWIVGGSGVSEIYGIVNAVDKDGASMIQKYEKAAAIDDKTLRDLVFSYGGDDNMFGGEGVVLFLNKKDLIAFGDVRSTTTLEPVYEIIPDGKNPNTGVIKDKGLSVKYCINANCTAYVDATASSDGVPTMIIGDPKNYKLGLFGNYEIEVSEDYKFGEGMLTVRGEVMVGGNVIKGNGFVVVMKKTGATKSASK